MKIGNIQYRDKKFYCIDGEEPLQNFRRESYRIRLEKREGGSGTKRRINVKNQCNSRERMAFSGIARIARIARILLRNCEGQSNDCGLGEKRPHVRDMITIHITAKALSQKSAERTTISFLNRILAQMSNMKNNCFLASVRLCTLPRQDTCSKIEIVLFTPGQ